MSATYRYGRGHVYRPHFKKVALIFRFDKYGFPEVDDTHADGHNDR